MVHRKQQAAASTSPRQSSRTATNSEEESGMSSITSSLVARFDRAFWGKASEPSKPPVRAGPPSEAEESLRTIKHPERSHRTGEYAKTNIRDLKQERVEPNVADSDNYGDSDIDMEGEVEAGHSNSVNGPSQAEGHKHTHRHSVQVTPLVDRNISPHSLHYQDRELSAAKAEWGFERQELVRRNQAFLLKVGDLQAKLRNSHEENERLRSELAAAQEDNSSLRDQAKDLENKCKKQHNDFSKEYQRVVSVQDAERKQYESWSATLKSNMQRLEGEKVDFEKQVARMSQIVGQLNKRGLPLPPDDSYFKGEFEGLIYSIRSWARLFTRGQPTLTLELLGDISLSDRVRQNLSSAFDDLRGLLVTGRMGPRLRARCVEVILFRSLMASHLDNRHIGFDEDDFEDYESLCRGLSGTEEESTLWSALTVHLLTKGSKDFISRQQKQVESITEEVYKEVEHFGSPTRATKAGLQEIVAKVAKLGLEMAQLPFRIRPSSVAAGCAYTDHNMQNAEPEEEEQHTRRKANIILSDAWVKVTFDENGRGKYDPQDPTSYYAKALVSCENAESHE